MKLSPSSTPSVDLVSSIKSSIESSNKLAQKGGHNWSDLINRISNFTNIQPTNSLGITNPLKGIDQLSGLLRLQMDLSRYQLRVELLSKVSESAVASIRKLQQNS
jgi:hypothetical protein